jgi:ubiquinone/menaquinone biosynthesis C-methylase UbiE
MAELKSFDRVAHLYDETRGLPAHVDKQIAEAIATIVREVCASPRLLEVGIGTGRMAVPLAALGVRVAGTDISSKMVALLRQKRRDIDVVFADAARPPFRAATFDAALFVHILHLVPDQEGVLRAAVPLLRPGGKLILGFETYDGVRLQADDVMEAIGAELIPDMTTGRGNQRRNLEAFRAVAVEAGAVVEHRVAAMWRDSITARAILDSNVSRHGSGSWKISDETMHEMLRRAEPQLVSLLGGIDAAREFNRTFELLIASPSRARGGPP